MPAGMNLPLRARRIPKNTSSTPATAIARIRPAGRPAKPRAAARISSAPDTAPATREGRLPAFLKPNQPPAKTRKP